MIAKHYVVVAERWDHVAAWCRDNHVPTHPNVIGIYDADGLMRIMSMRLDDPQCVVVLTGTWPTDVPRSQVMELMYLRGWNPA